jgi:hypothetical protein
MSTAAAARSTTPTYVKHRNTPVPSMMRVRRRMRMHTMTNALRLHAQTRTDNGKSRFVLLDEVVLGGDVRRTPRAVILNCYS